jgi:hypothetical protein
MAGCVRETVWEDNEWNQLAEERDWSWVSVGTVIYWGTRWRSG